MARTALRVVNFGSGKGGLATVGYAIYGVDGAEVVARSTAGVVEIGTSTGIYSANVTLPDYDAIVLWDTGEATPKYATEEAQVQLGNIEEHTGQIYKIYNSIKNQGEFMATLMNKMGLIEKNEGLKKLDQKVDDLAKKDNLGLTDIETAFNNAASKIKLPEFKQSDYSGSIAGLGQKISELKNELDRIPKSQKDYTFNLTTINSRLAELEKSLKPGKELLDSHQTNIKLLNSKLNNLSSVLETISSSLVALGGNDKNSEDRKKVIVGEIGKVIQYIQRLAMTKSDMDILASLGHKR